MSTNEKIFSRGGTAVRVGSISKTFSRGRLKTNALVKASLCVDAGEIVSIQGPSGGGKSTLLHILGGIETADDGAVVVGGETISSFSDNRLAEYRLRDVGFVFQAFNLIPGLTAVENIQLPMHVAGIDLKQSFGRAMRLLERIGMGHKNQSRPDELSGGEQQRVAIALALANDPPLILADEPTGNLDSGNAKMVIDLLVELARDFSKTVILATHDTSISQRTDQIHLLRDGVLDAAKL